MTATLPPVALADPGGPSRPGLTARECQVLVAWLLSPSKHDVTGALFLSASTVSTYIQRVRWKYEEAGRPAPTKTMLLVRALQDGLLRLDEI